MNGGQELQQIRVDPRNDTEERIHHWADVSLDAVKPSEAKLDSKVEPNLPIKLLTVSHLRLRSP